jgi:hypothetical protein
MYSFKQYLNEAKNTHLEHLEDEIINNGYEGGLNAIEFLKSLRNMLIGSSGRKVNLSVKWDGAPAVICGVNPENGKFFVGSKSVFNVTPKINYTPADIRKNHTGGLADKLQVALRELRKLNINGVVQGDFLYTPDEIKTATIRGEKVITFTPNTITYAIPSNSNLASRILKSKMGIIFHTTYTGRKMSNLKANFGVNVNRFSKSNAVFFDDAGYKDTSGVATFTELESDQYDSLLRMAAGSISKSKGVLDLMKRQNNLLSVGARLKIFFNDYIRRGQTIANVKKLQADFRKYYIKVLDDEIDKRKTKSAKDRFNAQKNEGLKFIDRYENQIYFAIASYVTLQRTKNYLVNKMNQIKSIGTFIQRGNGFEVTNPEGYVAVDRLGRAVKLVDRLEFSTANFTVSKNWIKG